MIDNCDTQIVPEWVWAVMTILQEARNQSLDGMIAVAEVIRNRTKRKLYSDGTVIGTVLYPYQFSGWNTKDSNRITCGRLTLDHPMTQMAIKAWKIALANNTDLTSGATHYHNDKITPPAWSKVMPRTTVIGNHIFYKES